MLVREGQLLDPALVGNKFARLESMRRAGFPVPALFCLAADAFDAAIADLGLTAPPTGDGGRVDLTAVREWSEAATTAVTSCAVPADYADRALAEFDELIGVDGLAAVRACVVPAPGQPGEDDVNDPFAGMSESFLYVPRADLLSRIVACWASAYKPEAVLYRLRRGGDPAAARVAVGVQRMVLGTRSFVVFTRDPRDGTDHTVIAAAHGIGEGVVQEKADVDHFFVDSSGAIRAEIVDKRRMVGAPVAGPELSVLDVPDHLATQPVLADEQVKQVVSVARRIEQHFHGPQDIEGTITGDGELFVVQARPLVLPSDNGDGPVVPWSNHNVTESYPGVSSALTYSVARVFYRLIFADVYRRMGVSEESLRGDIHHLERMIGLLDGRVFYRLDAWLALHGRMPGFELIRGWWEVGMGLAANAPSPQGKRERWLRALRAVPVLAPRMARHPGEVRAFLRWWDATAAAAERIDTCGPDELVRFYRRLWAQVGVHWGVTLTNSIHTILVNIALDASLRRWAGQRDRELILGLLSGGPENRSLAALRSALDLGERINRVPALRDRVLGADRLPELWDELVAGKHGAAIATAAAEHLRRWGDRAAGDLKLEQPTPRQQPWMVLDMVRPLVRQGRTVAGSRAEELAIRERTERTLRETCPSPVKRAVIHALASAQRYCMKVREDTRFCRTELYGLSRRVLYRLGDALADAGHIDSAGDVIDLTVEEVLGAFEGTLPGSNLRGLVATRRAERLYYEKLPEPEPRQVTAAGTALAVPRPLIPASQTGPGDNVLRGLGSCGGVVRARAMVALHPTVSPELCRDRILIARQTDPGWLFLMTVAKGLVVERGTLLSHTAITGRLLGVPTVVAVAGATRRIPDGAWVELDGSAGTVRLLDDLAGKHGRAA